MDIEEDQPDMTYFEKIPLNDWELEVARSKAREWGEHISIATRDIHRDR